MTAMNAFERLSYWALGGLARRATLKDPALGTALLRASRPERPEMYLAALWSAGVVAAVGAIALVGLLAFALPADGGLLLIVPLLLFLPAAAFVLTTVTGRSLLMLKAQERAKDLDANLLHGINYMLALTASGMQPHRMFRSLAKQPVYGVLAEEAGLIYRDVVLLGYDLITALKNAIERSPSERFREFLQGMVSTFASGVHLEDYLKAKVAQYHRQEMEDQRKLLDTLGIIAESFLVIVVAAPLFLITLLAVMSISEGGNVLLWGYGIALLYLPLCQVGVLVVVSSLTGGVDG